jgi:hypothetical protein
MGQQQTVSVAGSALRRMILVLAAAALMAATMVAMAAPAFAAGKAIGKPAPGEVVGVPQGGQDRDNHGADVNNASGGDSTNDNCFFNGGRCQPYLDGVSNNEHGDGDANN